jgi:hypothetical protein
MCGLCHNYSAHPFSAKAATNNVHANRRGYVALELYLLTQIQVTYNFNLSQNITLF